jgi:Bacterial archaeo-eukaryotic release factor family 10
MMTYEDLVQLRRRTDGTRVLSVYLPGPAHDPAQRDESMTLLGGGVSRIRQALSEAPNSEREAFLAATEHAVRALQSETRPSGREGIVIFSQADGLRHVGWLFASAPVVVEWRDGIVVAPYLRSLAETRPSIVVVVDSRAARVLRFEQGALEPLETFAVEVRSVEPVHMGEAPRPGFHHGVHGATGTDETMRREAAAFNRMLSELVHRVANLMSQDVWLVVGGMPVSVRHVVAAMPRGMNSRLQVVGGLTTTSSDASLANAAAGAIEELARRRDGVLVELVLDRARAGGRSASGWGQTRIALEERAASEVLLSRRLLERSLDRAETLARTAMDGGARVDVVTGEGALRLDRESGGVAAELRFPVPFDALVTRSASAVVEG